MDRWSDKVAFVTGASSGIGLEVVRELLKYNITVIAASRRPHLSDALKTELPASHASNLHSVELDITDEKSVSDVFIWIRRTFNTVHIVINSAGVFTQASLLDGPVSNWKKTFDVNVFGLCHVTKEAMNIMRAANVCDGHLIHINSVSGHKVPLIKPEDGSMHLNVYPASKHAVTALAETLRNEIRLNHLKTKVTSISPGLVKTEIFSANSVEPSGNIFSAPHIDTKDVASAVIYALSTPPNVNVTELTIQAVDEWI